MRRNGKGIGRRSLFKNDKTFTCNSKERTEDARIAPVRFSLMRKIERYHFPNHCNTIMQAPKANT